MKKHLATILLAIIAILATSSIAFATDKYSPYSYIWRDDLTMKWHISFSSFVSKTKAFQETDDVILDSNHLFDKDNVLIATDVLPMQSEQEPTVAYVEKDGELFFINENNFVCKIDYSKASTIWLSDEEALYFILDEDSFAIKTDNNTLVEDIVFYKEYPRDATPNNPSHGTPPITSGLYVIKYAIETNDNGPSKMAYDLVDNHNTILSTFCRNRNVWSETFKVLLTDASTGPKFVGYTEGKDIVTYVRGALWIFSYEDIPLKICTKTSVPEIFSFETDEKSGIVKGVYTKEGYFDIKKFL